MTDPVEAASLARDRAIPRGAKARAELDLTGQFFDKMREMAIERWESTSVDQTATREKLFLSVQTINAVRRALFEAVEAGKVEAHARHMAELLSPAQADR